MELLAHVGITVRNLDESIYFYHDVLGMTIVTEPGPWYEGPEADHSLGIPGASMRTVCLQSTGTTLLELIEYRAPGSSVDRPLPANNVGASHAGFLVDDIYARKAELEQLGIKFFSDVNAIDEGIYAGWRWVYFSDPDGYQLELIEIAYERPGGHAAGIERYLATRPAHGTKS